MNMDWVVISVERSIQTPGVMYFKSPLGLIKVLCPC